MDIAFWPLAFISVVSAILVTTSKNLARGVVFLIFFFLSLAGLYFLLAAQFIALIEVLVYAGAVGVLFAFVVMLSGDLGVRLKQNLNQWPSLILAGIFLAFLLTAIRQIPGAVASLPEGEGLPLADLGKVLLGDYLLPFELLSVVLLVALVAAVVLTAKNQEGRQGPDATR